MRVAVMPGRQTAYFLLVGSISHRHVLLYSFPELPLIAQEIALCRAYITELPLKVVVGKIDRARYSRFGWAVGA